jgi:hypothetical protein
MTTEGVRELIVSYRKNILIKDGKVVIDGKNTELPNGVIAEDFARKETRSFYKTFLSSHFENLILLTGAGSSIGIGTNGKIGKTRKELWESIETTIGQKELQEFASLIKYQYPNKGEIGDVEEMLSKANNAAKFVEETKESKLSISKTIKNIQQQIVLECGLTLPDHSPHEILLSRITARKVKFPRVKIFTLNYDTLFEQAAQRGAYTVIDGFSFSLPRRFNGKYYDLDIVVRENSRIQNEENYVPHVFHLYKPHGSLDWEKLDGEVIKNDKAKDPLIIYPKDSKYESSYEQPFFEMMSRFQENLRQNNVLLIVVGFSFYDKHIKTMILEAVKVNPSFRLLIVTPEIADNDYLNDFRIIARSYNNVILLDETFSEFVNTYPYPDVYKGLNIAIKKEDIEGAFEE